MVVWHGTWSSVDLSAVPADAPAAFCADLSPAGLLAGYRAGAYPMPAEDEYARYLSEARFEDLVASGDIPVVGAGGDEVPYEVAWWSPDPRPVIAPATARIGRRLGRTLRNRLRWSTTVDVAFDQVVDECRADRVPRWLTDPLKEGLCELHREGSAHSVEVWEDGELIGGAFGVRVGPVLSLDSMFHRRPGAARVAIADLGARFAEAGGQLLDAQWDSPAVRSLGGSPMPRVWYLELLRSDRGAPPREGTRAAGERGLSGEPGPPAG
ncbi:leucyl/phenylalanyl-tRNA--protein transferase [Kitasatospora herbaricolor]|uniref:Leucyl/phenylalanyl-tRNA--protein transferase n=1 Tax=Kitasatospora herbaricolor TaxID=68217 RepID=A0ABZ1WB04_9ACTN|nr:leucyl/phenylalanyl-tRNA--protein transferase [Kitasatospora herbaricolor]